MMPLPNLLKSIIGNNNGEAGRNNSTKNGKMASEQFKSGHPSPILSSTIFPKPSQHLPPQHKPKSLSQINGLHSHRNMKISHQLQLAESMYDENTKNTLDSRLSYNLEQCISDDNCLLYFLQYIESTEKSAKRTVTCFLQTNCLMVFLKEHFEDINFEHLDDFDSIVFSEKQKTAFTLFIDDFLQLYDHFSLLNCDDQCSQVEDDFRESLSSIADHFKESNARLDGHALPLKLFYFFWKSLYQQIETRYYELFLRSNFFLKYEIDILKSDTLHLSDIVHSSTAIASTFMDFMASEDMKIFVDFLIMHKNYKLYSGQHCDAVALYDRFFNNNGKSSNTFLDFSDSLIRELQISVRKEDSFAPDCFDKVAFILIQYFSKTYLPQFLQSDLFNEYIKSCQDRLKAEKMSIKANNLTKTPKLTKQDSNTSSHFDHSTDLIDSESIWKRNLKGQLQFTYIDNYGRMNSLFEPEPTKTDANLSGGKLTQVIRRLTANSSEEKKKEEEDAWRIAESIINDVCSVTIDHSDMNSSTS